MHTKLKALTVFSSQNLFRYLYDFENISIALLRCTTIKTFDRNIKQQLKGCLYPRLAIFAFGFLRLFPFNFHICFVSKPASYSKWKKCRVVTFTFTRVPPHNNLHIYTDQISIFRLDRSFPSFACSS